MNKSRSLATRAAMALLLMVGFYALAIGIAGALLWVPYAEWQYLGRLHLKLAAICIGAGGAVLWAIIPRPDRFEPPGPALTRANAPGLFGLIDEVAKGTSQAVPAEVYLLNDVNAWVTHRGGFMGVGSRRVMGVGLPLLAHLSVPELKAVIAHEFGHYVSGDVGLGPWIYKTRSAIGRALAATHDTFVEEPFNLYARLFLKTTLAVSREQEFAADRTAARVAGAAPAMSALERVGQLAPAYSAYLNHEVMPVLRSGFLPPVADGFERYLAHPRTAAFMEQHLAERTTGTDEGEYDTHPPMGDRIKALERLRATAPAGAAEGQAPLLADMNAQARALLRHTLGDEALRSLRPIGWDAVGAAVYQRQWDEIAHAYARWYGSVTVERIPVGEKAFIAMGSQLVGPDEENVNSEERIARAGQLLTAGLGAALARAGWTLHTQPGHPLELMKGELRIEPAAAVSRLCHGQESAESWRATCEQMGIAGLALAPPAPQG